MPNSAPKFSAHKAKSVKAVGALAIALVLGYTAGCSRSPGGTLAAQTNSVEQLERAPRPAIKNFVRLTDTGGRPLLVNLQNLEWVEGHPTHSTLFFCSGSGWGRVHTAESVDQIWQILEARPTATFTNSRVGVEEALSWGSPLTNKMSLRDLGITNAALAEVLSNYGFEP